MSYGLEIAASAGDRSSNRTALAMAHLSYCADFTERYRIAARAMTTRGKAPSVPETTRRSGGLPGER
jgi:hypothetical protein